MFRHFLSRTCGNCDNSILGYNTTILCHEHLVDEWRNRNSKDRKNVMIGANVTALRVEIETEPSYRHVLS